jgi:TonB family protein
MCSNPKLTREAATSKDFREALVHLQVLVSAQGRVEAIKVTKDPGFGLAEAAAASVRHWRFSPAKGSDGKPVASWNALEVVFRKAP